MTESSSVNAHNPPPFQDVAGFTDRSRLGRLWVTGRDAVDLLNRLTTNDLDPLPVGEARWTVLTNGDGRVIDHLHLASTVGGLWCITSEGRANAVAEWLDLYTFGEDIAVENMTKAIAHFAIIGPEASRAVRAAGFDPPELSATSSTANVTVVRGPFGEHDAYDILAPETQRESIVRVLRDATIEVDAGAFEAYRISQGVPIYGSEFGDFNNPLEARLLGSISGDKGCYTGQEVIARLQTYRKVQRLLMAFESSAPIVIGEALTTEDGTPVGSVTSASRTLDGHVVGLALVRTKHASAGTSLYGTSGDSILYLSEPRYALATEPSES